MLAGTVATTPLVNRTGEVAAQLFAPFPSDAFPTRLNRLKLMQLLNAPLAAKVPVSDSMYPGYQQLHPELFEPDDSRSAGRLAVRLLQALQQTWPLGDPSENLYNSFWDSVGYGLPEFAGGLLNFEAVINRWVSGPLLPVPIRQRWPCTCHR